MITELGIPSYSISVSLNVLLTFMIVGRLALFNRDIRNIVGPLNKPSGLYTAVSTMLIESSALHAVTFLLFVGTWAGGSLAEFIFFPILAQTQVRSILRFLRRPALPESCLILLMTRSFLRYSLFYASPTEGQ